VTLRLGVFVAKESNRKSETETETERILNISSSLFIAKRVALLPRRR
jgi:hypothetical protein